MIFAPLVKTATGAPLLTWHDGRKIPHVAIDAGARELHRVTVPAAEHSASSTWPGSASTASRSSRSG